jgi:hypothetical protein
VPYEANYIVKTEEEAPLAYQLVSRGDPIKVDVTEVTAGNGRFVIIWLGT